MQLRAERWKTPGMHPAAAKNAIEEILELPARRKSNARKLQCHSVKALLLSPLLKKTTPR